MARQTFTQLQNTTKDYISASSGSLSQSTIANHVKEHVNKTYHRIYSELKGYIVQDLPQTASTVADQQFYHYPPSVYPPIVSATWTVASVDYPLLFINSQLEWDKINEIDFSGTTIPQYIFPRRDDFGLYPTPQTAGETITLVSSMLDRDMTIEDYTTGTVTATNADGTITGAATTFTPAMAGRWFQTTADQYWYRIKSYTDATHLELESVFEGTTETGGTYTIGESPELPTELHEFIPHGAASAFYTVKKDFSSAQAHNNYFRYGTFSPTGIDIQRPTSGIEGAKRRYAKRSEGSLIYKNKQRVSRFDERFSTTISSTI